MTTTLRTDAEWTALVADSIARAKREITADIAAGIVPADCADFSTLHDYVDANEYGGLCEDGWLEHHADEITNASMHAAETVQDTLHRWLKEGRI